MVSINKQSYAFGAVLDYTIDTQVSEFGGIDSMLPIELAPERLRVSMSMRIFRTTDNDPSMEGIHFQKSTKSERDQDEFAQKKYIEIEVRDRQTDQTIMFIPRALVSARSASVDAEGLMTENWSIVGIGFVGAEYPSSSILDRIKNSV